MAENNISRIKIGNNEYILNDEGCRDTVTTIIKNIASLNVNTGTTDSTVSKVITAVSQSNGKIAYHSSDVKTTIDDTATIPTSAAVKKYVDNVAGSICQLNFTLVDTLPKASVLTERSIYLVPHTHSDDNDTYDEYITVLNSNITAGEMYKWEKIGNTDISLTGLVTDVTATFNGSTSTHSHTWSQTGGKASYDKTTDVVSSYASTNSTKTISATYTPTGTVTHSVTGTQGVFVAGVAATSSTTDVITAGSVVDSYSDGVLTLSFSPTKTSMTYVTGINAPTAKAVTSITNSSATFTGTPASITMTLPNISNEVKYAGVDADVTVTGTISTANVTPTGTITVNTTKHD